MGGVGLVDAFHCFPESAVLATARERAMMDGWQRARSRREEGRSCSTGKRCSSDDDTSSHLEPRPGFPAPLYVPKEAFLPLCFLVSHRVVVSALTQVTAKKKQTACSATQKPLQSGSLCKRPRSSGSGPRESHRFRWALRTAKKKSRRVKRRGPLTATSDERSSHQSAFSTTTSHPS